MRKQMLSKVMDNAVTIPVVGKKIGLDAVIGLIPYAGAWVGAKKQQKRSEWLLCAQPPL